MQSALVRSFLFSCQETRLQVFDLVLTFTAHFINCKTLECPRTPMSLIRAGTRDRFKVYDVVKRWLAKLLSHSIHKMLLANFIETLSYSDNCNGKTQSWDYQMSTNPTPHNTSWVFFFKTLYKRSSGHNFWPMVYKFGSHLTIIAKKSILAKRIQ